MRGENVINSVTQVTGLLRIPDKKRPDLSFLEVWRGNVGHKRADETLRKANEIGTAVHKAIETFLTTGEIEETQRPFITSFSEWKNRTGFEPTSLEPKTPLYRCADQYSTHKDDESCDKCFCGTYDAVGLIDGVPVIADWKTSSRFSLTNPLQLAAYAALYNYTVPILRSIQYGYVVRLDKKTHVCHEWKINNLNHFYDIFCGLLPASYYVKTGFVHD